LHSIFCESRTTAKSRGQIAGTGKTYAHFVIPFFGANTVPLMVQIKFDGSLLCQ
jgi:hypothetical protein